MRRGLIACGLFVVLIGLAWPAPLGAQRVPAPTPTRPTNLLTNGGFEEGSARQWNATNNAWANGRIAEGWRAWWRQPTSLDGQYPNQCPEDDGACQPWHQPEYRETRGIPYAPPRIRSGENSQMFGASFGLFEGGVDQKVSGVPAGWRIRFSIWAKAWSSSDSQDTFESSGQPGMHMRVGIDPNGGSDPWGKDVVWSKESDSFDQFSLYSVDATSRSDTVTVFFRAMPERALKHIDVMLDDAELITLGPPPPTPVVIDAPNQVAGAPVPGTLSPQTIIHVIQPGDTLFAIAQYYRTDLAAIYAANGLNESSVLKVGQSIVIPLPVATPLPTAVPTPMPVPVAVGTLCVSAFEDTAGDGHYDGDDGVLPGVAFIVADRAGRTVAASDTKRCFADLPVGAYSVFAQVPAGYIATTDTSWGAAIAGHTQVDIIAGGRRIDEPESGTGGAATVWAVAISLGSVIILAAAIMLFRYRKTSRLST